ncbi:D-2-hydroxyacid dehydrogenase [Rhizobium leguminosarum bv. viciae]|nr:D-2-hydroxyacid dehydrogenase [Rhizobium leguminosarum bv. viciae]
MSDPIVLATNDLPFDDEGWKKIEAIAAPARLVRLDRQDHAGLRAVLETAEIALVGSDIDQAFIAAPKLRWLHVNIAGMDGSARPELFDRGVIVTGAAGRSAPALAEHAMMFMLALNANLRGFETAQRKHQWGGVEGARDLRALFGQTLGIVGTGATGKELAVRAKAFGMTVLGYCRRDRQTPDGFDQVFSSDRREALAPLLERSDFVVMAVNLSNATRRMIGREQLSQMKPSAIFINLARGGVVDEEALTNALYAGRLRGAGLDVFEVEPLPADSRLWDAPNTMISPHFSAVVHDRQDRTLRIIAENFQRYRAREPMLNTFSAEDIYDTA